MKCSHCKIDFKQEQMIEINHKFFCCTGCKSVYEILHDKGLDEFYTKLGNQSLSPVQQGEIRNYDNFIKKTKEGFGEIYLMIHGIHCSACIWLNEKILIKEQGIIEIDINSFTHKARIVFDENLISLKHILELIESIGYKASAYDPLKQDKKATMLKREFYSKLVVAIACVMNVMWIAVAKYAGFFSGMDREMKDILNFAEFILSSPVLFYTGSSFYKSAFIALKNKSVNMDTLVISGATLAYIYSVWAMFSRVGEVYFDSVAMIICFVFIGKYLEVLSKKKASDIVDGLNDFLQAEVLVFNGEKFVPKDVDRVEIGDIIQAKSGDKILIDGICVSGEASLDTSSLSGEELPVFVNENTVILSASIVIDGVIEYKASKTYEDSKLAQIISLLELSNSKKAKIESLVNQISAYFSRTILSIALLCFCFWFFYREIGLEYSLIHAISVLIIACPCALALATPVSNLVALAKALKQKVLFKSSSVIEDLSKCDVAVFDKTGVLTNAKLEISDFYLDKKLNLSEFLGFINLSKHPVSKSIAEFLNKQNVTVKKFSFENIKNVQAKGLKATLGKDEFVSGSSKFLKEENIECDDSDKTHFYFAKNKEILAKFEFDSVLRSGAIELIRYLKTKNIQVIMLTGDNERAAKKIAKELDIQNVKANFLPEDKMKEIENLSKNHKVVMIGDGINDALALKHSAVAISLKEGADIAIESSDVLLLKNDLLTLKNVIILSKKTFKIIKENLAFSIFYNALTIPLAFLGLINPLIAALSMSFSSVIVVLNSLRIHNE